VKKREYVESKRNIKRMVSGKKKNSNKEFGGKMNVNLLLKIRNCSGRKCRM